MVLRWTRVRAYRTALCLITLVSIAVASRLILLKQDRVNRAGYELIESGMTFNQVVDGLGLPPGDYSTDQLSACGVGPSIGMPGGEVMEWWNDECIIYVGFNEHRVVVVKHFTELQTRPPYPLHRRLWRWITTRWIATFLH
jgi:hypothetical protein